MPKVRFEWDERKNRENQEKHGILFHEARKAFTDPKRIIVKDVKHGGGEERLYCIGKISNGIVMVRFTYREDKIRIFGAGFWREGKAIYEKKNSSIRG